MEVDEEIGWGPGGISGSWPETPDERDGGFAERCEYLPPKNHTHGELVHSSTMTVPQLRHRVLRLAMIGAGITRN
jgi:hypothetical protein